MNARKKKKDKEHAAHPEVEELVEEIAEDAVDLEAAADEAIQEESAENWREKYLRTLAELDNFQKRSERDRLQQRQYANEGLMRDLLPVLDALEMARSAEGDAEAIREGVQLALNDALRILGDRGLESIEALDRPFDPRFHEAVGLVPDPSRKPNTVFREERRGYRIKDRVLRPSRVQIAVAPPTPQPPEPVDADGADRPEEAEES